MLKTYSIILYRLPLKVVSHPTSHFALYDTTPSYDHLRVFGFACYPNTSATAPHKLSPRSTRCLFLGYSPDQKGYRCLDLTSHRIIIFRHVVFDEDVFPLVGSSPPTDLDSLLESDPSTHPSPAPRLAPHAPSPLVVSTPPLARLRSACGTCGPVDLACATRGPVDPTRRLRPRQRAGTTSLIPSSSTTAARALLPRRSRTRAPQRARPDSPTSPSFIIAAGRPRLRSLSRRCTTQPPFTATPDTVTRR
jgi:hypothetical protein